MKNTINFLPNFEKQSKLLWGLVGFFLIVIITFLDILTCHKVSFSLFYLVPISLVTWLTNWQLGMFMCLASSIGELFVDIKTEDSEFYLFLYAWDTFVEFSFSFIIVLLLSALRKSLQHERKLASTDFLTGAVNSRSFFGLVQLEIDRFRRNKHPFTLVYIDLDNFKIVNNTFGHAVGDKALIAVVYHGKKYLRKIDTFARLGGDEFALLLPETNQESAQIALSRLQHELLEEMKKNNWPITFSIGALTCNDIMDTTEDIIKMADELMYSVKHSSKNAIKFFTYPDTSKKQT